MRKDFFAALYSLHKRQTAQDMSALRVRTQNAAFQDGSCRKIAEYPLKIWNVVVRTEPGAAFVLRAGERTRRF